MRIRFASPLARMLGVAECDIAVDQGITVGGVVALLACKFSHTEVFREGVDQDGFVPYVWVALRNGRDLLDADDTLTDSDELEFLPPILGG